MDETGADYTEGSKPERKTPIQYINAYIYGIEKDGNNSPVCERTKETQMYRTVFWTLWERERGGMIRENGIETCITSYKKQITSPGSMQDTGCLGLVHWDDPEEWEGGSKWGTHVHPWQIHVDVWQNQYNIVN